MYRKDVVIMATGGMDSTTLMYHAMDLHRQGKIGDIRLISMNYGQTVFPIQVEMINFHANQLGIANVIEIPITYQPWQTTPGLFTEGYAPTEKAPLEDWEALRYENFFVEGRNIIMAGYALAYASAYRAGELWAGYLYGDEEWTKRRSYKLMTGDNSPQFVDGMNMLSSMGFSYQVRFRAPWYEQSLNKAEVYHAGIDRWDIDYTKTYSCYFTPECGICDNCLLRAEIMGGINNA